MRFTWLQEYQNILNKGTHTRRIKIKHRQVREESSKTIGEESKLSKIVGAWRLPSIFFNTGRGRDQQSFLVVILSTCTLLNSYIFFLLMFLINFVLYSIHVASLPNIFILDFHVILDSHVS